MGNIMQPLSDIMMMVLNFFYAIVPNYGVAIILLTLTVKIALYPLTISSTRQMKAMQDLQPKLKKVQEKHKEDPQKLQKETMALYAAEGVNPFGGCLPMLLQIPFFIALFFALNSKEFAMLMVQPGIHGGFLWLKSLAQPDHTYVMAVLIGLSTYWSQKATPMASQQNNMMLMFMPIFITMISLNFPSGVQLYWVASNAITAVQQMAALRSVDKRKKKVKEEKDG
jgi:YidC/Oxa1 family membrane protein insertase